MKKGFRNVVGLGFVSMFTDFSTEMTLSVLPFFLVNSLGISRSALGLIDGSAEFVSYAFRMVSGSVSDKIGNRKMLIIAGYSLSAISKPIFATSTGWLDTLLIRNSDRIGKGLRTAPRDALIADSIYVSGAGRAFGLHRTLDQTGAIMGPLAAFFLLQVTDIRGIFLLSIIPGIISITILIFIVKEVRIKSETKTKILSNIRQVLKDKKFVFLVIILGIFNLGAFNFSFVLLRASEAGIEPDVIPIIYAIINIAHTAIGIPAGIASDKIGIEKMLVLGFAMFMISVLIMGYTDNINYVYITGFIFGLYIGISETTQRALIPRYIASGLRGTAFGIYNLVAGMSFFTSNALFGYLWDTFSLQTASMYSIILATVAIVGVTLLIKKHGSH